MQISASMLDAEHLLAWPGVLAAVNAGAEPFRSDPMRTRSVDRRRGQDYSYRCSWLIPAHPRTARGGSYAHQPRDREHLLQIVRLGPAGGLDGARAVDHVCRGTWLGDAHPR